MKKLLAIILAMLIFTLCACVQENPETPDVPEEPKSDAEISVPEESKNPVSEEQNEPSTEEDTDLQEWVESLEPIEVYDTKNVYPWVIGEIFEIIMESEPEERKSIELLGIEVCGGENEFFVDYTYSCEAEDPGHLFIRVRMNNDGLYTLVARGGGPLGYGLQKTDITLEDIRKYVPQVSFADAVNAPTWEYKEIELGTKEQLDKWFYYIDNIEKISGITISSVVIEEKELSEEEAASFVDYFYLLSPGTMNEDTNPSSGLDIYIYAYDDAGEELWRMSLGGFGMVIEFPDDSLQYRFEVDDETKGNIFSFVNK